MRASEVVRYYGWIIAVLRMAVYATAAFSYYRPDRMHEYIQKRNLCNWEHSNMKSSQPVVECTINGFDFDEGPGHVHIIRYGPVSLHGGEEYVGNIRKNSVNGTKWRKGVIGGPVDPHTGKFISYPPLHVHHLITLEVPLEKGLGFIPFLDSTHPTFVQFYPRTAADHECLPADGGTDCFLGLLPPGYGELLKHGQDQGVISWLFNDVRELKAPPLKHYLEYAEFYIDEMYPDAPPMKQGFGSSFIASPQLSGFGGKYKLEPNVSSYNFNSYYVPMDMELAATVAHSHWARGDEFWVVRGTQADLGLPNKQILDVVSDGSGVNSKCNPFPIPRQDTIAFRSQLEANIQKAAIRHKTTLRSQSTQSTPKPLFLPFNKNRISSSPPEILCKYSAQVAVVTEESVAASDADVQRHYRDIFQKRPEGYSEEDVHSALKQSQHMYRNVILGDYYRVAADSENAGGLQPRQCHRMDFKAGEYLTIIEFNAARIQEKGKAELPLEQHTIFRAHAHFPHLANLTKKTRQRRRHKR